MFYFFIALMHVFTELFNMFYYLLAIAVNSGFIIFLISFHIFGWLVGSSIFSNIHILCLF